ncbi:MAG: nicotinate-nucleotide--dimethylbenzimidazole phosphoribosyltransferase [Kiritimatiellae bacterium]|nr:nicotinate-nucleotide--dimethylbenzimidazole phosphoribosyltransferase [Kiritimatiellia bacterium]
MSAEQAVTNTLNAISSADGSLSDVIQAHLDDLTKPQGSLGRLEAIAMVYCRARGTATPTCERKRVVAFAADHGVVAEGVSAFPAEVTPQMVMNMLSGGAAINVLTRHAGAELRVVDIGVNDPLEAADDTLYRRKVRPGTANIAQGPAMTEDEMLQAVSVGIDISCQAATDRVDLLGSGEMGIGNTTASTALFSVLLDLPVEEITGRGTGIDDSALAHKIEIIKRAIDANRAKLDTPLGALAAVGGLEIAGICGLVLGAAANRIPMVVDGFISTAGALCAIKAKPEVADYLFFSHRSNEQGHRRVLDAMNVDPILDLDLRLGEGTGAALAMPIIEAAIKTYNEMATFSGAGVSNRDE